jgi:hypothetical protein
MNCLDVAVCKAANAAARRLSSCACIDRDGYHIDPEERAVKPQPRRSMVTSPRKPSKASIAAQAVQLRQREQDKLDCGPH